MSNIALDRTKQHELNPYRPPSAPNGYKLVRWKPVYDMIVSGHILGRSNKDLAAEYDYTTVQIGNILRSDEAQKLICRATENIQATVIRQTSSVVEMQEKIQKLALEKTLDFLEKDELAENSPFAFIDRAMRAASIGKEVVNNRGNVVIQNNVQQNHTETTNITLKTTELARLNTALEISNG